MIWHQATPLSRTLLVALGLTGIFVLVVTILTFPQLSHVPTPSQQRELSTDLTAPAKKDIALQLVSAAENSTLDWRAQYDYIEYNVEGNDSENRGYTGGLVGFTSRTGDMLDLVKYYSHIAPGNLLEKYTPALEAVNGSSATTGLGKAFVYDWQAAANAADGKFKAAQDYERDRIYFTPAVKLAKKDGLQALGQFIYYDASVTHGPEGLAAIRAATRQSTRPPTEGGSEISYLDNFLDMRTIEMHKELGHQDTSRLDTMQRKLLNERNLTLHTPFTVAVYGDDYTIR